MLAEQGSIYVKVEQGLDFFLRPEYDKISPADESYDQKQPDSKVERKIADSDESTSSFEEVAKGYEKIPFSAVVNCTSKNNLKTVISMLVGYCKTNSIENPVDILRAAQKAIVCGKPLGIESLDSTIEEAMNQIMINRYDDFKSAKEELSGNNNSRKTLEVTFYGETARHCGGPRKEFFRLCLQEIKKKYFVHDSREEMVDDYNTIGVIFALSILKSGPLLQFLNAEIRE